MNRICVCVWLHLFLASLFGSSPFSARARGLALRLKGQITIEFKGTNHYRVFVILQLQVLLFHKLSTLLNGPSTSSESDSNQFNTFIHKVFQNQIVMFHEIVNYNF